LPDGEYKLEVKSLTGESFEMYRSLHMNLKKFMVLAQTDKSIYKPGDKIMFRVIVLDGETKPFNAGKVEIFFTDGAENRVKQFDDVILKNGFFQGELQLSEFPVMGIWKINTKFNNIISAKPFEVAEYVLPKFEFKLDCNPTASFKGGKIVCTLRANYTFGKIAKGSATVELDVNARHSFWGSSESAKKCSKTVQINGKEVVEFNFQTDMGMFYIENKRQAQIKAKFKEELSGKELTAEAKIIIQKLPYQIELKKKNEKFKPGLPYEIIAYLKSHDKNSPITDYKNPINFKVIKYRSRAYHNYYHGGCESFGFERAYRFDDDEDFETHRPRTVGEEYNIFPVDGVAKINIDLDRDVENCEIRVIFLIILNTNCYINFLRFIQVKYFDCEESISDIRRMESESNQYLQANLLTKM
jgi:hypothetical protein